MILPRLVLLVAAVSAAPIDSFLHVKFMQAVFRDFNTLYEMQWKLEAKLDNIQKTLSEKPKRIQGVIVRSRRDTSEVEALPQPEKFIGAIALPLAILLEQQLAKHEQAVRNRTIEATVKKAVQEAVQTAIQEKGNNTRTKRQASALFHLGKHLYQAAATASQERPTSEEEKEDEPAELTRAKREAVAEALPAPERLFLLPLVVATGTALGILPTAIAGVSAVAEHNKRLRAAANNRTRRYADEDEFARVLDHLDEIESSLVANNRTRRDVIDPKTAAGMTWAFGVGNFVDNLRIALLARKLNETTQEDLRRQFTNNTTPSSVTDLADDAEETTAKPEELNNRT